MASSPDATFYAFENFGVMSPMVESPDATFSSFENFGFESPRITVVHRPAISWGTVPMFPRDPAFLLPDDSPAVCYSFENMTT